MWAVWVKNYRSCYECVNLTYKCEKESGREWYGVNEWGCLWQRDRKNEGNKKLLQLSFVCRVYRTCNALVSVDKSPQRSWNPSLSSSSSWLWISWVGAHVGSLGWKIVERVTLTYKCETEREREREGSGVNECLYDREIKARMERFCKSVGGLMYRRVQLPLVCILQQNNFTLWALLKCQTVPGKLFRLICLCFF